MSATYAPDGTTPVPPEIVSRVNGEQIRVFPFSASSARSVSGGFKLIGVSTHSATGSVSIYQYQRPLILVLDTDY